MSLPFLKQLLFLVETNHESNIRTNENTFENL